MLLPFVFRLRFLNRLPLRICRAIAAVTFQRDDVIHDIAGPAMWVPGRLHELMLGGFTAFDFSVCLADRLTKMKALAVCMGCHC